MNTYVKKITVKVLIGINITEIVNTLYFPTHDNQTPQIIIKIIICHLSTNNPWS